MIEEPRTQATAEGSPQGGPELFAGVNGSASLGYVDSLRADATGDAATKRAGRRWGHRWCHLWADDLETLHKLAAAAGLRREWFQNDARLPHYDLTPPRRAKLLAAGLVVEASPRRWLAGRRATPNVRADRPEDEPHE